MHGFKSAFVSVYSSAAFVVAITAIVQLVKAPSVLSPWVGVLVASLPVAAFFGRLFVLPTARTPNHLWGLLTLGVVGSTWSALMGGQWEVVLASAIGVLGLFIYDFWFSQFGARESAVLATGQRLPDFALPDADGQVQQSSELLKQPTVWMFFRGNWCPICMAQIREVATQYREIADRGAQVVLVSPQPEGHTRKLAARFDVPMRFLVDANNQVARQLGICAENGLPLGLQVLGYDSDVPMPTVLITDSQGTIVYSDQTSNYRIRPEPDEFLRILDGVA